jgi:hypothetical protein
MSGLKTRRLVGALETGGSWEVYTFRYMVYKPERAVGLLGKLGLVD